jgi:hypothetical protein
MKVAAIVHGKSMIMATADPIDIIDDVRTKNIESE